MVHRHIINEKKNKKKNLTGNSLAVQWLGLCTSTVGSPGSIPSQRTKVPQDTGHSKKKKKKEIDKFNSTKINLSFLKRHCSESEKANYRVEENICKTHPIKDLVCVKSLQSCPTLGDPMDYTACQALLSIGIFQSKILE